VSCEQFSDAVPSTTGSHTQQGDLNIALTPWKPLPVVNGVCFSYLWPDSSEEPYLSGFQAEATVNGRTHTIVIGFGERTSAGMQDRARAVVFYNLPPKQHVLVEFAGQ